MLIINWLVPLTDRRYKSQSVATLMCSRNMKFLTFVHNGGPQSTPNRISNINFETSPTPMSFLKSLRLDKKIIDFFTPILLVIQETPRNHKCWLGMWFFKSTLVFRIFIALWPGDSDLYSRKNSIPSFKNECRHFKVSALI